MEECQPYLFWHHFASDDLLKLAQQTARLNRHKFVDTTVETNVTGFRQSKVCWHWEWMDLYNAFTDRMREITSVLKTNFPIFPVDPDYELQLTVSGDGDYFKLHQDNASPTTDNRVLTFVYYFSMNDTPGFSGGQLTVEAPSGTVTVQPNHNSLVVFPSGYWHEVLPVIVPSQCWEDGRATLNGWVRSRPK